MSLAKRFGIFALVLALASILIIFLSPVLVKNGMRVFLWWKGRQQGLTIAYQKIDAPFLKPVVVEGLHLTNARPCAFVINIAIPRATLALNLRSLFFHSNARILHQAWIDALRGEIRRNPQQTADCNFDWRFLHRLLADDVRMNNIEFRFANGATDLALHGATFSASEIESGKFAARQVDVATPLLKKSFADLRGATKWENDRLTVGALSLARGLDIETITADFSRLEKKRISFELNLDAFGGKVRASLASESREKKILWDVAGTASSISLEQMSRALDWQSPAGGAVRASKFTFRGDTQNLSHATASVWVELGDFTWRDRVAETVMLGASLYNRQVDIGQLYVKQRTNQLTLTGEYTLPSKSTDWINPNFRADISASITELGEFAKLFGGTTEDFAGALTISGTLNARDRNFAGQITADGDGLRLWAAPVDSLRAKLTLKNAQLNLDSLQAKHLNDFFNMTGEVNLLGTHAYAIKANGAIANVAEYWSLLPERIGALKPEGRASIGWDAHGTADAHSGEFQIQAENVRLTNGWDLQPFELKIAGSYSPKNIFAREFRFANPHAEFNASFTVAPNYLQLQSIRFDLNGQPKLHGDIFIPIALHHWWREEGSYDFDRTQKFGVNLTLDEIELGELQSAVTNRGGMAGKLQGHVETFGTLGKVQAKADLQLRDFASSDPRRVSVDFVVGIDSSLLRMSLTANAQDSSPATIEMTLPLQLAASHFFAWDKPITLKVDCPAVLLSKLPPAVTHVSFREGILSANVDGSGTLRNPTLMGTVSCLNGRFAKSPGPITGIGGQIDFRGSLAAITIVNLEFDDARLPLHGAIDFSETSAISIKVVPDTILYQLTAIPPAKCINAVQAFASRRIDSNTTTFPEIQEMELRGGLNSNPWSISLTTSEGAKPREKHSLCTVGGDTLQLAIAAAQKIEFGQRALRIFRGRNQPTGLLRQPLQP
jgi:hypothetical protein